jgi:hypothetical protein
LTIRCVFHSDTMGQAANDADGWRKSAGAERMASQSISRAVVSVDESP